MSSTDRLVRVLRHGDASDRLRAVMSAGADADPAVTSVLVERCAVEPDFFVRDMLTWALTRMPADDTVPLVVAELARTGAAETSSQARSQALHTLSKIGDVRAWPDVRELLHDHDVEVARAAWRAAVALVPQPERGSLATTLAVQLGQGDVETRMSLSRALVGLGDDVVAPVLLAAADHRSERVREHAALTRKLLDDPDSGSELALELARREVALGRTRSASG